MLNTLRHRGRGFFKNRKPPILVGGELETAKATKHETPGLDAKGFLETTGDRIGFLRIGPFRRFLSRFLQKVFVCRGGLYLLHNVKL
jgi:hypothetical protein